MCIICAKPQGAKLPNDATLRAMFTHNPHGAGFMYARDGRVEIRKGFMTYDAFTQALRDTVALIGADAPLVMHFRITTHGGTCPGNTHPFPLTNDITKMHRTSSSAIIGIAHNGIIRSVTPRAADVSDTMEYIAAILFPVWKRDPEFYRKPGTLDSIRTTITGSRMAIMLASGEIVRIGAWIKHDGCWFSNDSFQTVDTRWITPPAQTGVTHTKRTERVTDTHCVRLPWERDARIYAYLMPLTSRDMIEDERGDMLTGEWFAITKTGRVFAIDADESVAYETDAHVITKHTRYDRRKTVLFEIAC